MKILSRFFRRLKFRKTVKTDETRNVVDSMVKARKLYKELSIMAHPDKHPDQKDIADELMQKINVNKHNYSALNH